MASSEVTQELAIASSEAQKLAGKEGVTPSELRQLRKNIDEKRKALARPLRVQIKEIDQLFADPIKKLSDKAKELAEGEV